MAPQNRQRDPTFFGNFSLLLRGFVDWRGFLAFLWCCISGNVGLIAVSLGMLGLRWLTGLQLGPNAVSVTCSADDGAVRLWDLEKLVNGDISSSLVLDHSTDGRDVGICALEWHVSAVARWDCVASW